MQLLGCRHESVREESAETRFHFSPRLVFLAWQAAARRAGQQVAASWDVHVSSVTKPDTVCNAHNT